MNLASLMKKGSLRGFATTTPATVATVATDKPFISPSVATVATVNVAKAKNPLKNDPVLQMQAPLADTTTAVSSVPTEAVFPLPERLSSVSSVPPPAILEKPVDWHMLDAAYLVHHFSCAICIAAGRSSRYGLRCGIGAVLWRAYSEAQLPETQNSNFIPIKC